MDYRELLAKRHVLPRAIKQQPRLLILMPIISTIISSLLGGNIQTGYVSSMNNSQYLGSIETMYWRDVTLAVPVKDAAKCVVFVDGYAAVASSSYPATSITASLISNSVLRVNFYMNHIVTDGAPANYNTSIRWKLIEFS